MSCDICGHCGCVFRWCVSVLGLLDFSVEFGTPFWVCKDIHRFLCKNPQLYSGHVSVNMRLCTCVCMCLYAACQYKPQLAHPSKSTLHFNLPLFSSLPPPSPLLNVTICQHSPFVFFFTSSASRPFISVSSSSFSASFSCSPHLVFNPTFLFIL